MNASDIMNMKDVSIHQITENFSQLIQLPVNYIPSSEVGWDGTMCIEWNRNPIKFKVKYWKEVRKYHLMSISKMAKNRNSFVVMADRIPNDIKEELKNHEIAYLDLAGNCFIKTDLMYVLIEGRKGEKPSKLNSNRIYSVSGLKVLFTLLTEYDLITKSQREIAMQTASSLGTINLIINGLKQSGYLLESESSKLYWNNQSELIEKWLILFQDTLRTKLDLGTFRLAKMEPYNDWRTLPLESETALWGGEPASALLTDYLEPELLTIYTEDSPKDLIKKYHLIPDSQGKVSVYKKFWSTRSIKNQKTVHPLLVYADLIATGNSRCLEVASILSAKYDLLKEG